MLAPHEKATFSQKYHLSLGVAPLAAPLASIVVRKLSENAIYVQTSESSMNRAVHQSQINPERNNRSKKSSLFKRSERCELKK